MKWVGLVMAVAGLLLVGSLYGCAGVDATHQFTRLKDKAPAGLTWQRTQTDRATARDRVTGLLEGGLTKDEAVRAALAGNKMLQADLEEIGVSQADLVEASLPPNPRLEALVRFPRYESATNVELQGSINLAELWRLPLKRKAASARMEVTLARLGWRVVQTSARARSAWAAAVRDRGRLELATELVRREAAVAAEMARRRTHGYASDIEVYRAGVAAAEAGIAREKAALEAEASLVRLARVLGLKAVRSGLELKGGLPELPAAPPPLERVVELAGTRRADVQAARLMVNQARQQVSLAKAGVVKDLEVALNYEQEADGEQLLGPGVALEVPIFDQNQAEVARARYRVRQYSRLLEAKTIKAGEEAAVAHQAVVTALRRLALHDDRILPLRQQAVDYTRLYVGAMQLNKLYLLEAERDLTRARMDRLTARAAAALAWIDLERAVGGRLE